MSKRPGIMRADTIDEMLKDSTPIRRRARKESDLNAGAGPSVAPDEPGPEYGPRPVLVNLATVKAKPVEWVWPSRIPRGMLTLLGGDPGMGKSTIAAYVAARVTTGAPWDEAPGASRPAGSVIWLTAEDDVARVLVPRLDAAGADRRRVVELSGVRVPGLPDVEEFSLDRDLAMLRRAIESVPDVHLCIVDPVAAYLGDAARDSHNNARMRGLLTPLKKFAEQTGVAVLAITHLNKAEGGKPVYRLTGSLGFVAAARIAWIACEDPNDKDRRLFLCVKSNVGPMPTGLSYTLSGDPGRVEWDAEPVTTSAIEAFETDGEPADRSELQSCSEWLREVLSRVQGLSAAVVMKQARENGFTTGTLRRAKNALGIKPTQVGFHGGWVWALPTPQVRKVVTDAHAQMVSTCGQNEHLCGDQLRPGWNGLGGGAP